MVTPPECSAAKVLPMSESSTAPLAPEAVTWRSLRWAGVTLGFALGGFFDGIVLHQVLQWHHLLSALDGGVFGDVSVQILADGLFHLVMYAVALVGLWLLWQRRHAFAAPGSSRAFVGSLLMGFAVWHVVDALTFHWLLALHRIRMDSDIPLVWDLLWLGLFGILPGLLGLWLLRRPPNGPGGGQGAAVAVAALVIGSGAAAAWPQASGGATLVVFGPATEAAMAAEAIGKVDGRLIWTDRANRVWAIDLPAEASSWPLYRSGALLVSRGPFTAACASFTRL